MLHNGPVLSTILLVALTQAPVTLASPSFSSTGVDAPLVAAWQDRFVSRVSGPGVRITTSRDIQTMLGLERQRELLGCSIEGTSCLAELAGALGVELLLTGSIVKSDSGYLASIRVLKTQNGESVFSPSERFRDEAAMLDWLDETADALRRKLVPVESSPVTKWIPAMAGAGLLVGSGVCFGLSASKYGALTGSNPPTVDQISSVRREGETLQWVGVSLAAAGGVAVLTSIIWAAVAPAPAKTVQVSIAPVNGGAVVGFSGALP